ncbi:MAG: adenylate/guanylate cyclase domain-containing protein, partial [Dehalococcoidia bacterium]
LAGRDEMLWSESVARQILGWQSGKLAHAFAELIRASMNSQDTQRYLSETVAYDATPMLTRLTTRTLVVSCPLTDWDRQHSRKVAAAISGAELIEIEDTGLRGAFMNAGESSAIKEFLGLAVDPRGALPLQAAVHTILFTDLTSSTALTQRLGDAKAQELVRAHNAIVREALAAQGGSEIKHTGDGIMASFPTASGALDCAVAIQRGVEGSRVMGQGLGDLAVHIGVNAGEPVAEEQDLFGTAVQLARRICDHAEAGQILASDVVRQLAAGKNFLFADIGEVVPKGFEDPVRLYEVRWRGED